MSAPPPTVQEVGAASAPRRPAIDVARGVAVLAMIVYHTAWDLSELALVDWDVLGSPAWIGFARSVAASFLVLAGIGLVLAHRAGLRRGPFLRRLAIVAAAALAVTVATRLVFPTSYVFFGILHNIAVSSVLALPFLRAPVWLCALAAVVFLAAPLLPVPAVFDAPALTVLGLGTRPPVTNDFVPVLPWSGFVLAGVAAARLWPFRPAIHAEPVRPPSVLAAIGRRSLLVYLLHQPVIFGALWGVRELVGPNPSAGTTAFVRQCTGSCVAAAMARPLCETACRCTAGKLTTEGLRDVIIGEPSPERLDRGRVIFRECVRDAR